MVIPLNPEEMEIGEWLILFFDNFEGMGRGVGNSKELCAWSQFFLELLASRRGSVRQKITVFENVQVSPKWAYFFGK